MSSILSEEQEKEIGQEVRLTEDGRARRESSRFISLFWKGRA